MYNRTEHIYLYAKHWYKRSDDPIMDVQTIIENCEGHEFSRKDVVKIVFHIALRHLLDNDSGGSTDFKVEDFIYDLNPDNIWKFGVKEYEYWTSVLLKSLSVLSLTDIEDIKRLSNIDLFNGHPNSKVFELSDTGKDQKKKLMEYASNLSSNL